MNSQPCFDAVSSSNILDKNGDVLMNLPAMFYAVSSSN